MMPLRCDSRILVLFALEWTRPFYKYQSASIIFMLGVPKAASTSLFAAIAGKGNDLCYHHQCEANACVGQKESHFFDNEPCTKTFAMYLDFLSMNNNRKCSQYIEGQPVFCDVRYPFILRNVLPQHQAKSAKFIVIFREPISRDISWFNMLMRLFPEATNETSLDFCSLPVRQRSLPRYMRHPVSLPSYDDAIICELFLLHRCATTKPGSDFQAFLCASSSTSLSWGMYAAFLSIWLTHFDRHQILSLNFHNMLSQWETVGNIIASFVGVPQIDHLPKLNSAPQRRAIMNCATLRALKAVYEPWNAVLYALLHQPGRSDVEPEFGMFPEYTACSSVDHERHLFASSLNASSVTAEIHESLSPDAQHCRDGTFRIQ